VEIEIFIGVTKIERRGVIRLQSSFGPKIVD
jgi:hypothetical protein